MCGPSDASFLANVGFDSVSNPSARGAFQFLQRVGRLLRGRHQLDLMQSQPVKRLQQCDLFFVGGGMALGHRVLCRKVRVEKRRRAQGQA